MNIFSRRMLTPAMNYSERNYDLQYAGMQFFHEMKNMRQLKVKTENNEFSISSCSKFEHLGQTSFL